MNATKIAMNTIRGETKSQGETIMNGYIQNIIIAVVTAFILLVAYKYAIPVAPVYSSDNTTRIQDIGTSSGFGYHVTQSIRRPRLV